MESVIYNPAPKFSLMFKCKDCGHKFKPFIFFLPGKCPRCESKKLKPMVGMSGKQPPWVVN